MNFSIPEGAWDVHREIKVKDWTVKELACGIVMLEHPDGEEVEITPEMLKKLFSENF